MWIYERHSVVQWNNLNIDCLITSVWTNVDCLGYEKNYAVVLMPYTVQTDRSHIAEIEKIWIMNQNCLNESSTDFSVYLVNFRTKDNNLYDFWTCNILWAIFWTFFGDFSLKRRIGDSFNVRIVSLSNPISENLI